MSSISPSFIRSNEFLSTLIRITDRERQKTLLNRAETACHDNPVLFFIKSALSSSVEHAMQWRMKAHQVKMMHETSLIEDILLLDLVKMVEAYAALLNDDFDRASYLLPPFFSQDYKIEVSPLVRPSLRLYLLNFFIKNDRDKNSSYLAIEKNEDIIKDLLPWEYPWIQYYANSFLRGQFEGKLYADCINLSPYDEKNVNRHINILRMEPYLSQNDMSISMKCVHDIKQCLVRQLN